MQKAWQSLVKHRYPYLFIAPTLIILFVFSFIPILVAVFISFTNMNLAGLADWSNVEFKGVDNFVQLFSDAVFRKSMFNTLIYVVVGVPLVVIVSMAIAILINQGTSWIFKTFRVIYYMPSITNIVAIAVIWGYLYNSQYGLINHMLEAVGISPVRWLQDPTIAKFSLIIMAVWKAIGLNMIIFLAALQGIPRTYYEAAQIDGASRWQQLMRITVPLLGFATFFVSITTLIGWIQFFEEPLVMTKGDPLNGTTSMALFIYQTGFQRSDFGYAAAGSIVLFAIIILVTIVQFKARKKDSDVEY
ncbi:carbohydrate ABC transporter permease [Paenibacillus hunanensis]|uniref:Multiple sugar transport system permease protein n=1 Tax=Paenibacillus hunanensis TaxID=539262 RepID=A0ABU1IZD2_9BACL|nr:sugar ABC transporter permease [Paenibacillus hunanensis]MCL9660074.1 sugar ABC transporter permease [Paenibacillus hunanensis]MDR6244590.1 multiple sugar transport system permease protein [Paenibacillus hunanensis]WPP39723.1 sugar ABC transporter permease [Paenibacillus hunanensis]GGJ23141.1 sugar ABC transporter permease [Paenibacillus hunanensis]